MTGLEKMVKYAESWVDAGTEYSRGQIIEAVVNKARSLLQEETATANEGKEVDGNTSDGYHTFNELYDHRIALYLVLVNLMPDKFWKSKKHEDGSAFEGWFILGGNIGTGDISYHLPISKWDEAKCQDIPLGKKWDGHTAADVVERLSRHRPVKVESLAELADRKGMWVQQIHTKGKWWFDVFENSPDGIDGSSPEYTCGQLTYPAAESAAKKYLLSLPDKV